MDILSKADRYIGHPREVDEGYEVSMRRTAYMDGYQDAVNDIKSRVEAMRDNYAQNIFQALDIVEDGDEEEIIDLDINTDEE